MPSVLDARWGKRSERPCRICASHSTRRFRQRGRAYLRCSHCYAITLDVSQAEYDALNPTYDPGPLSDLNDPESLRSYLGLEDKRAFLQPMIADLGLPCRVLDVGCGAGGYLVAAHELGCEAYGIEPSEAHSTLGRRMGLTIRTGYFSRGMFPAGSFDLVLLSHVIEHIYLPRTFLEGLVELLRPGGRLVVVTPNASSVVALLSGKWWVMLKPVDHVSMLSETSYQAMRLDELGSLAFSQSEYPWEAASSLAAAGRDLVRGLLVRQKSAGSSPRGQSPSAARASSSGLPWRSVWSKLRVPLQLASLPIHQLAVAQRRQACLVMTLTRPGTRPGGDRSRADTGLNAEA